MCRSVRPEKKIAISDIAVRAKTTGVLKEQSTPKEPNAVMAAIQTYGTPTQGNPLRLNEVEPAPPIKDKKRVDGK